MSEKSSKNSDYYPLRWKFADFVENIVILHRTKAAIAVACLGLLVIIVGLFILGWSPFGDGEEDQDQVTPGREVGVVDEGPDEINPAIALRPVATEEQIQVTPPGTVIELGVRTMRIVGGFPSDVAADDSIQTAIDLFPTKEILDDQLLSVQFPETDEVLVRVIEPDFFLDDTAEVNPDLVSVISDIAEAVRQSGRTVLVVGHAATGPLSTERAESAADLLIAEGLTVDQVSFTAVGNSEPLADIESWTEFILR